MKKEERKEIMEDLRGWGFDGSLTDNRLESYAAYLERKLDESRIHYEGELYQVHAALDSVLKELNEILKRKKV